MRREDTERVMGYHCALCFHLAMQLRDAEIAKAPKDDSTEGKKS